MNDYSFGKTIKELRHRKSLTQSRLAELLSVSPQAISKWENNIGYPDLTFLAPLSDIFGVTIDQLLGKNAGKKEEEIRQAKERTLELWRAEEDTSEECVSIWRELCRKYPSDHECRNQLAFELHANNQLPPEEERKRCREAAALYESVLDESTDSGARSEALYQLVWLYGNRLGEIELAIRLAKTGAAHYATKSQLLTHIPGNPERKHWQQYEVWISTHALAWAIAGQDYSSPEEKIFAIRTALKVIDTVCYDRPYGYFDSFFSEGFRRVICELRAQNGLFDDTIYDDIDDMIQSCRRADEIPLGSLYFDGNLFLDSVYYEHTLPSNQSQFAKELLEEKIFDPIRGEERFQTLYEKLC